MDREKFLSIMHSIVSSDAEVDAAWQIIMEAVELHAISPEEALESIEALRGEADNGLGFDEYHTGADLDHWDGSHYDFSRVCISFVQTKTYCSRAALLEQYDRLRATLSRFSQ